MLSQQIVLEFCKICAWAHKVWLFHREFFDDNPRREELQRSKGAEALMLLNTISHEYSLLQITKLHDNSFVAGKHTLGIDFVMLHGAWAEPLHSQLVSLSKEMEEFAANLRLARNKILSHNDLSTVLSTEALGSFQHDYDKKYFGALQQFVDLVHMSVIGGPYPFDDLVINDVKALLSIFPIDTNTSLK